VRDVASLGDQNDDVRAGAATALLPAVPAMLAHADTVGVAALVAALTEALTVLDDLTASTAAMVALLGRGAPLATRPGKVCADMLMWGCPSASTRGGCRGDAASARDERVSVGRHRAPVFACLPALSAPWAASASALLQRLWPFFRHPVTPVRLALLRIVLPLCALGAVGTSVSVATELLAQLFQSLLVEPESVCACVRVGLQTGPRRR
jgi:hypothetical protein